MNRFIKSVYSKILPSDIEYRNNEDESREHFCWKRSRDDIIHKWIDGDGYPDLVGKWTLDAFGFDGTRTLVTINFCPFCGKKLL